MIEIVTDLNIINFKPLDLITGRANWALDKSPQTIIITLLWHTVGKGNEASELIDQIKIAAGQKSGESSFTLKIPEIVPYSYNGKLFKIAWIIEATTEPIIEKQELEIYVSSDGQPVNI